VAWRGKCTRGWEGEAHAWLGGGSPRVVGRGKRTRGLEGEAHAWFGGGSARVVWRCCWRRAEDGLFYSNEASMVGGVTAALGPGGRSAGAEFEMVVLEQCQRCCACDDGGEASPMVIDPTVKGIN
jgi:hypothetical protein